MGYTHTLNAIYKVKHYLDVLRTTKHNEIKWAANEPRKLAYQIHRAFASAEVLSESSYQHLRQEWEVGSNRTEVVARRRKVDTGALILEANDSMEVVEQAIAHKESGQPLKFPLVPDFDNVRMWASNEPVHIEIKQHHIIIRWL